MFNCILRPHGGTSHRASILPNCAEDWKVLSPAEKDKYRKIAGAHRVHMTAEEDEEEDEPMAMASDVVDKDDVCDNGVWGIGSGDMPLGPGYMHEPPFTAELQREIDAWKVL